MHFVQNVFPKRNLYKARQSTHERAIVKSFRYTECMCTTRVRSKRPIIWQQYYKLPQYECILWQTESLRLLYVRSRNSKRAARNCYTQGSSETYFAKFNSFGVMFISAFWATCKLQHSLTQFDRSNASWLVFAEQRVSSDLYSRSEWSELLHILCGLSEFTLHRLVCSHKGRSR